MTPTEQLYAHLQAHGLQGRVVSMARLGDLRAEIEGRRELGLFDPEFDQERLSFFGFEPPAELPGAASILVVGIPRPQTRVTFTWRGQRRTLLLPPTYWNYAGVRQEAAKLLRDWLSGQGYRLTKASLPQKALAVRSGLAEYGRNNITYVPDWGSFYQPVAFFSDLPCADDDWREPRLMEHCEDCHACQLKCPTGAIGTDRFLLHAERCLVYHNERSGQYPFPAWIDPAWHNCLMGCMLCQRYCPVDKPLLDWFDGDDEFSAEETALLMKPAAPDELSPELKVRLERLGLLDSLDALPRNLGVFFTGAFPLSF
ncbi:MAG: hypothetical protein FJ026_08745 [Chloroflexi bacterium]|nr:hypothetical protein [Chloroflexota bacterium]